MNDGSIDWQLVNPEGIVNLASIVTNPQPETLEGKTVLLRWNGKHNGDIFLKKIAGLLTRKIKDIKIIKSWEVQADTATHSLSQDNSKKYAERLAALQPDIVIGSQCD